MPVLTKLQQLRIQEAIRHSSAVLAEMKQKPLKGNKLAAMKALETAVQSLEIARFS